MNLFENNHFLVIEKRPGWLTIPGRMGEKDPTPCEQRHWEKELQTKLWVVHRLDREVSGVMLFAKNADAHRAANSWFENRTVSKTYEALGERPSQLTDLPPTALQRWESHLLRGKKRAYEKPFGKHAVTEATFIAPYESNQVPLELWRLNPLTGRAHQLRYELSKRERPVWGDTLYGAKHAFPFEGGIGLRAVELSFEKISDRKKWELPERVTTLDLTGWLTTRC